MSTPPIRVLTAFWAQGPFHRSLPDDGGEGEARFGFFGQGCSSCYWLGVRRSRQSITSAHSGLSSVVPDRSFQWCMFVEIEIEPGPPRQRVGSDHCSYSEDFLDQMGDQNLFGRS